MKERISRLVVAFDTSIIWNPTAHDLVSTEVADTIQKNKYSDLEITWHLSDIVRHERIYQMQEAASKWMPTITNMENLLGHSLNLTETFIQHRIVECVDNRLSALGLIPLILDAAKVDWERIKLDAVYRRPPFQPGNTEKGFRDAMILESFFQLVERLPSSTKQCRIAFVARDEAMVKAVTNRVPEQSNIRVYRTIEELQGLVNTLVSEVDEEFIQKFQAKAASLFYDGDKADSKTLLWNKYAIENQIKPILKQKISLGLPKEADDADDGQWSIHLPNFVKKDGQRVFWSTRIDIVVEAFKRERPAHDPEMSGGLVVVPHNYGLSQILGLNAGQTTSNTYQQIPISNPLYQIPSPVTYASWPKRVKLAQGLCVFEIAWSTILSTSAHLIKPVVESPKFISLTWADEKKDKS